MRRAWIPPIAIRLLALLLLVFACAPPPVEEPGGGTADEPGAVGTPTRTRARSATATPTAPASNSTPTPGATPSPSATATRRPTATPTPSPTPRPPTATPTPTERQRLLARKRGIHLPNRVLDGRDYMALEVLRPGWVVLLSAQLGEPDPIGQVPPDPRLQDWLRRHPEVRPIVRMWPVKGPTDPQHLAARIVALHRQYPRIEWFIPANEPDIEWPDPSWGRIAEWATAVWWNVEWYRRNAGVPRIKLLFPAMSQGSRLDPEGVGYDAMREAIEHYLGHGDGFAGHAYWDRGDVYLVEDRYPSWLRERLLQVPYFVTEAGRRPVPENGLPGPDFGEELVDFAARTRAAVVAPFILSSDRPEFRPHAFVNERGIRAFAYTWAGRQPPPGEAGNLTDLHSPG